MGTRTLPSGTVTFLFTDVESSTKLLHALGANAYAAALAEHRRLLRDAFARHGGVEVDTQGDAFFVAFSTATGALAAARQATEALAQGPIRVRIGLHTGTPLLTDEGYVGADVHRAARIAAAGHGGQILVSAAMVALLDPASEALQDLGEHRLKDLSAPERIWQADDGDHPPLKTLHRTNLPHGLDSFVGREREIDDVIRLLSGGARLVTLTGPGGTGKTRLAQTVAAELVPQFADGVFWIPLASLRDSALVLGEVASVTGARADVVDAIGDRTMLLVLDNLEQIIQAARDLDQLLQACPNLRILVTSRELLRVRGEAEYAVPPLADTDAVTLFTERSGRTDGPIGELCRQLDNLPLAVELAAARARLLSPAQILDRLAGRLDLFRGGRDADPRQATLRAAIDWSHELLATSEQRLFAALAIFRGGWTFEAAEAIADADVDDLASLVDHSLVVRDCERFRMLETIRAYAAERLRGGAEVGSLTARHAAYFRDWAESRYVERFAAEDSWVPEVAAETDNLRAALEWASEHDQPMAAGLAGAMAELWSKSGRAAEARAWLARVVPYHLARDATRARALTGLGSLNDDLMCLSEALEIWREMGDIEGEADALESVGWAHDALGDHAAAARAHEASLELRGRVGSPDVRGLGARAGLCHVLVATNATAETRAAATDLLEVARRADAAYLEQLALHYLADAELLDGNWQRAEDAYRTALDFSVDHDFVGRATDEVIGMAMAMAAAGRSHDALRVAAAARAKQVEIGKGTDAWWQSMQRRHIDGARSALPRREAEVAEAEGAGSPFDSVVAELLQAGDPR